MGIRRIGIAIGGGPAPGTNGVIAAVSIEAINKGCSVLGIHNGFEWLAQRYTDEQHELTIQEVSRIHLEGGSILGTSRAEIAGDPASLQNTLAALRKLGVDALVVAGGDDLVSNVLAVEEASNGAIKCVLIPKTIDNDMWMPVPLPTLGYETAREVGVEMVQNLMEDAKTTGRWYFAVVMGRSTGQLTLGVGKAAGATCTIIPEEFHRNTISLSNIADIVEGTMIRRRAIGKPYGVILLAEALSKHFSPVEISGLQDVDRDAQGNIRFSEIDLGRKVKSEVQARLEHRNIKMTIVDKMIGYELRCAPPIPYDAEYARDLGYAAVNYLLDAGSNALITIQGGEFQPVPLVDLIDPHTGRGRQRPVDVDSESYQVARDYMVRLDPTDLRDEAQIEELALAGGLSHEALLQRFGHQS